MQLKFSTNPDFKAISTQGYNSRFVSRSVGHSDQHSDLVGMFQNEPTNLRRGQGACERTDNGSSSVNQRTAPNLCDTEDVSVKEDPDTYCSHHFLACPLLLLSLLTISTRPALTVLHLAL